MAAFIPTQAQRDLVAQLTAMGATHEQTAKLILHHKTSRPIGVKLLERVFRDELDTGTIRANAKVAGALFTAATTRNDTTAMIFWLKCRAGWKEAHRIEHTGANGGPIQQQQAAPDLSNLSDEELAQWEALMSKAAGG